MKPIVKYQGGKTRELPIITKLKPDNFSRIVEPFSGGAAVSLNFDMPTILNDINTAVINLYEVVSSNDYHLLQNRVNDMKNVERNVLEQEYYKAREVINNFQNHTCLDYAFSYIMVRQLCFSGMERYNNQGKFNVPFGHYEKFSCNLSLEHHNFFVNKVKLYKEDAIKIIEDCDQDDWIFIDPPYIDRLGYITGDGGNDLHNRLIQAMKKTKSKWLFIHTDCDFYRSNLSEFNIQTKEYVYSQRFGKNKNHSGAKVNHIYITNY